MSWHHKDIQIAVFCDVISHAVATCAATSGESTISIFRISDPNNSMQETFLLVKRGDGGSQGPVSNKDMVNHLQNPHYHVHMMQGLTETLYLNKFFLILKVG